MTLPTELTVVSEAESAVDTSAVPGKAIEGRSLGRIAWTRLKRDKVAMVGACIIVVIVLVAIFGPLINDAIGNQPDKFNSDLISDDTTLPLGGFGGSTGSHLLGVEPVNGRDILARLIAGTRISLMISLLSMVLSLVFGLAVGISAGFYRGAVDTILARVMDLLLAFPTLLFSIALLSIFNSSPSFLGMKGQTLNFVVLIFVIGFFGFPYLGRIVRGQVLSIREKEYIDAARSLGASDWRLITREVLPNLVGPVLVWMTLTIPSYILTESGLSFLGVGVQPPTSSWGQMLSSAGEFFSVDPTYLFWPGLTLFITVMAFNLFGDGLRDALDPKSGR
ncbi:MAG: ABC transporter permease [Actinobacteria bacterium]|nr:ABC transporter permease [Actinomycetota bacterium]